MTTFIFKKYNLLTTSVHGGHKYFSTRLFYGGLDFTLPVFLKDKISDDEFNANNIIAIKGRFEEDINPLNITLYDGYKVHLPNEDNWETFFVDYFLNSNVETFSVNEYEDGYTISTFLEHNYVWCDISKNKQTLKKLEFGRYLPLESSIQKRKSTSCTKGVFLNNQYPNIKFMQTSWDGEDDNMYKAELTLGNKQIVTKILAIPFHIGWTEFDYRLGKGCFYKTTAQVTINGQEHQNTFTLLDIGEQDIPFFTDKVNQWVRTKWADCFINNIRRHIDKTEVKPIDTKQLNVSPTLNFNR